MVAGTYAALAGGKDGAAIMESEDLGDRLSEDIMSSGIDL